MYVGLPSLSSHYLCVFDQRGAFAIVANEVNRPSVQLKSFDVAADAT